MTYSIYLEGEKLDLYKDENVIINSSIQNINDISKVFTDYSQNISLPASKNNNKIFKHFYNANLDNGFDYRTKKDGFIELDTLLHKNGKIRLESVDIKNGKPTNYTITFFGLLVGIKDTFKDDYLDELDFSALDHTYDYANVRLGLIGSSLSSGDIIYPLISSKKRWYYNSDTSDDTNTDDEVNIAYETATNKGIVWNELKPAVKVNYIISAIESKYGITFTNDFIGTAPFNNLFLWCSREKGNLNNNSSEALINFTSLSSGNGNYLNLSTDTWSGVVQSNTYNETIYYNYSIQITPDTGFETVKYTVVGRDAISRKQIIKGSDLTGIQSLSGSEETTTSYRNFENTFYISAESTFNYVAQLTIEKHVVTPAAGDVIENTDVNVSTLGGISSNLVVANFMPRIKVMDFFNGIISLYNLAVESNSNTEIFADTLDDWYASGNIYDITKYVDKSKKIPIKRGKILSGVKFKFEEPQTFLATEFLNMNNIEYGDLEALLKDENGTPLDGEELEISVPFEQMIYERLTDANDDVLTDTQIGYAVDDDQGEVLTKAHLFYNIDSFTNTKKFALLNDSGNPEEISSANMPFHGNTQTNPIYTTLWGSDLNEWDGLPLTNSLYKLRYEDYITDIFSVKRRVFNFNTILPSWLMNALKLNDKLVIEENRYLINNMSSNLTTGEVNFELINDIF